jgi:hypothetical protein
VAVAPLGRGIELSLNTVEPVRMIGMEGIVLLELPFDAVKPVRVTRMEAAVLLEGGGALLEDGGVLSEDHRLFRKDRGVLGEGGSVFAEYGRMMIELPVDVLEASRDHRRQLIERHAPGHGGVMIGAAAILVKERTFARTKNARAGRQSDLLRPDDKVQPFAVYLA